MTNKEARKILLTDADFTGSGEKAALTAEALCLAVEALEKVDLYRWHDLMKNPSDLPEPGETVLLLVRNKKCDTGPIYVKETGRNVRRKLDFEQNSMFMNIAWSREPLFQEVKG